MNLYKRVVFDRWSVTPAQRFTFGQQTTTQERFANRVWISLRFPDKSTDEDETLSTFHDVKFDDDVDVEAAVKWDVETVDEEVGGLFGVSRLDHV